MAETPTPVTPRTSAGAAQGTSKLALLISFVAGAFASWLVITNNIF